MEELEKLGELRDKGIITDEEFEAKKKDLLGL
ncbi:MAG: SHOCT domain-containing protein [Chloroflexota bacterium]|nr:MAG: SHOCT domain-containing protein [Chloroflexota bacterium]